MKIITKTLLISSMLLLASCATIISGSRQTVEIFSEPTNATVSINEIEIGKTPIIENLKRNQDYRLVLKLDGYKPYETVLEKKFNAWYIGNIVFGGVIGLVVDPITGAMYKLQPEEINGGLKKGTILTNKGGNISIMISMEIDPDSEMVGQLEKSN